MGKFSRGRVAAGCAIGFGCGVSVGVSLLFSAWVLPIQVAMAFLWVWSGWPSVVSGAVGAAVSSAFTSVFSSGFGGWGIPAAVIVALVLPGALAGLLTRWRKPFYQAVGISVLIQWAALIAVAAVAWLILRRNLVDALTDALREVIEKLPRAIPQALVLVAGQAGLFGDSTGINFSQAILSDQQLDSLIAQMLQTINTGLKLSMPMYVLTSGATAGAASYTVAAYARVRMGDDPPVPFVKPEGWRLTPNLILGPPALAIACLILDRLNVAGADAAYLAMFSLSRILFIVQAVGALERRMKASGMTPARRGWLIVAALVIGGQMMPMLGIYSALLGSEGLITKRIKKRMDGKGDE